MRWFGWLRRKPAAQEYVGRHRPGSWGEIALPPLDVTPPAPRVTTSPTVTAAPAPAVVHPPTAPQPDPAEAPRQRVRLGFADGTSVEIEDESGESAALRRAASRLIDDPR